MRPEALDPGRTYVTARAASISGNHARAAELYAQLAAASSDKDLRQRAINAAISAGDMELALRLVRSSTGAPLSVNSKLLLVADALKRGQDTRAVELLSKSYGGVDFGFWDPLVRAWNAASRRDPTAALSILAGVPRSSAFAPFVDEQSALILLKLGRTAEAEPYARRAIGLAQAREYRLRLALAAGFAAARDRPRALAMLDGISGDTGAIVKALDDRRLDRLVIDSAAEAFADQLIALALEMRRSQRAPAAPLNVVQIARFAAPDNSSAAILLGNLLAEQGRLDEALAAYRSLDAADPLRVEALDSEVRALTDANRQEEALRIAMGATSGRGATADDFARLGDAFTAMDRHGEAASAYGQAVARSHKGARLWPLLLLQASALESAGRWPEAKAAAGNALALAPNEPVVLNFLGYSKLEHGEDLDAAEALIRKASELAPDEASITDSLGWALYKRGRIDEAIDVLQKAAMSDPAQAEIQEHLGDALYSAGRHYEARFAWRAALATAEDEDIARITAKIDAGLSQATAAR